MGITLDMRRKLLNGGITMGMSTLLRKGPGIEVVAGAAVQDLESQVADAAIDEHARRVSARQEQRKEYLYGVEQQRQRARQEQRAQEMRALCGTARRMRPKSAQ